MRVLLPFFTAILLSSCFHKDVLNDRADDVINSFIYKGKDRTYIITKEEVFQATSKESKNGVTTISGYAEYRLTSYDLQTGKQMARANLGDGNEKAFCILGTTEGKIWIYSLDPELGFHCRNPKTMEIISDEKTISANGALKGFAFAKPERTSLNQFYAYNSQTGKLFLSDKQGFHYYYDPSNSTLEKTEDVLTNSSFSKNSLGSNGYFSKEVFVSLKSDVRNKLVYANEDSTGNFSYIKGQLLIDNNPFRGAERTKIEVARIEQSQKSISDSLADIHGKFPKMGSEGRNIDDISDAEWKAKGICSDLSRRYEALERDKKNILDHAELNFPNPLLSDGNGYFYVLHAVDVCDTARTIITKLQLTEKKFQEIWSTPLPHFYVDPDKAKAQGAFETVFSKGNPSFSYRWFDVEDGKLIMISQLRMVCLDVKSGKILWEDPL